MAALNKVILIGNLGQDPEIKATPSGDTMARFSLATTETWKNPEGEKQSKTEWHNCVVFGKSADTMAAYCRKGQQLCVEGKIEYRKYTDQAGVEKTGTNIRVHNFVMLGKKDDAGEDGGEPRQPAASAPKPAQAALGYEDDITF
jgi:single-strand DNA-binding protein